MSSDFYENFRNCSYIYEDYVYHKKSALAATTSSRRGWNLVQGLMVSSLGMLTMTFLMNIIRDSFVFEKLCLHLAQPCPILYNAEY